MVSFFAYLVSFYIKIQDNHTLLLNGYVNRGSLVLFVAGGLLLTYNENLMFVRF